MLYIDADQFLTNFLLVLFRVFIVLLTPRGLRLRSSAAGLLRLWVRIPPGAWMFVCCECYVLSGRGLCDGLITHPEESYQLWRVLLCDQETSNTRRLKPATGAVKIQPQWLVTPGKETNKLTYSIELLPGLILGWPAL